MVVNATDTMFFTNEPGLKLEDRFKSTLVNVETFDILVGYFRTSGFKALCNEFENIDKIRILIGLSTDKQTVEAYQKSKQLDFLESHSNTKDIFSKELEKELYSSEDNYDVEYSIRKFVEFLRCGKLELRAFPSRDLHAKVYISKFRKDDRDYGRVITGSSNFSENGLNSQYEFNVELKNSIDVKYAQEKFDNLWTMSVDLTETYIDTINDKTWLNDTIKPYELYIKFLYEYFKEKLEKKETLEIKPPKGFMKLEYQQEAVRTISEIVDKYNGCFLADVVGLGKTYITAMYMQNLPGKKLVICPPPIIENWEDAINDFGVRSATVVSLGKLEHIKKKGYQDFDYIFVDETHRFRNENTSQYQLLHEICYGKKVILITATPLNNSIYDFYPLITLFQPAKNSTIPGMKNLEGFFVNARNRLKKLDKSTPEYIEEVKNISKEVRNKVLKYILVRRTRRDVKEYFSNDIKKQGLFFPEVDVPHRIVYQYDEKTNEIFDTTISKLKHFTFARYQPGNNLKATFKRSDFEQTQERNLVGFMKTMLIKRLESSRFAFLQTVSRFINSYELFIKMYNSGTVYISKKVDVYDYLESENEDELIEVLENDSKAKIYKANQFNNDFIDKLEFDLSILKWMKDSWSKIDKDFKKNAFIQALKTDEYLKDNKILIFSESMETGLDLYNSLYEDLGNSVLFYSSGECRYENKSVSPNTVKDLIHKNYDPKYYETSDDIKVLITTDVLAEGINLHRSNIIINYDLPWNPTRVLQRVGRVNRVGSKFDKIHIYNIFPSATADNELNLEDNIKAKIQAFHETLGEDAKYLTEEEETTNHKLFGENFYDKVTNKDTYNEDESEENSDLKYIKILEDIRDNDNELFNKVKYLPKKSRTARKIKADKNSVITFFRKGALERFYLSDGETTVNLGFEDAVKYFECDKNCEKQPVPHEFYHLLQANKDEFFKPNEEDDIQVKKTGGSSNHKYVRLRIDFAIKEGRLTDIQEDYMKKILALYDEGKIINEISKSIKDAIEKELDSVKVYQIIKNNIPETYLTNKTEVKKDENIHTEIILSEFLTGENNG